MCECVRVCVLLVGFLSSKKGTDQEKKIIEMNKRETGQKEEGEKMRRKLSWLFRALAHPTDVDHEDIRRKGKKSSSLLRSLSRDRRGSVKTYCPP